MLRARLQTVAIMMVGFAIALAPAVVSAAAAAAAATALRGASRGTRTAAGTVPCVMLNHSADRGVCMPLAGLGMGSAVWETSPDLYLAANATRAFLQLGGRRTDSADSYRNELGVGLGMRRFMNATRTPRSAIFIGSKIGPGGLCYPLGYNEAQAQARGIVANYSGARGGSSSPAAGHGAISFVDLLLIHWPTNYGPCQYSGGPSIPTTDPLCDRRLRSYSERGCRVSTWRGMLRVWKQLGLARAIGVSNFNSTDMQARLRFVCLRTRAQAPRPTCTLRVLPPWPGSYIL